MESVTKQPSRAEKFRNILLCASPLLSFMFIHPEWLARLVAITGVFCFINILVFAHGINPKANFLYRKSRVALQGTDKEKQKSQIIGRALTLFFGCFLLYVSVPPLEDCVGIVSHGKSYLVEIDGQIQDNNTFFGMFFLDQYFNILINDGSTNESYSASAFFLPTILKKDVTYHFLIAPRSTLLLDCSIKN